MNDIRVYRAKRQSDAIKLAQADAARDGRTIESMNWQDGRAGCLRFMFLGLFAFVIRPKGELTVVLTPVI